MQHVWVALMLAEPQNGTPVAPQNSPVIYETVSSDVCESHGMHTIYDVQECIYAGSVLGYSNITQDLTSRFSNVVDGCSIEHSNGKTIFFNPDGTCNSYWPYGLFFYADWYYTDEECRCSENQLCVCRTG